MPIDIGNIGSALDMFPCNVITRLLLPWLICFRFYFVITVDFWNEKKENRYEMDENENAIQIVIKMCYFFVISARFGGEDVERSRGKSPPPANCIPESTVVELKLSDESDKNDPTIVVFPSCTRVKRCGGCCNNNLVTCQPLETNTIVFEVLPLAIWIFSHYKYLLLFAMVLLTIHFFTGLQVTVPQWRKNAIP